jgi:hypothetical protein
MAKEVTTTNLDTASRLAVTTKECFVVVSLQEPNICLGPFGSLEKAQGEGVKWLIARNWLTASVFQIVGTITKPIPDLRWTQPADGDEVPLTKEGKDV